MLDVKNRPKVTDAMNELESFHRFLVDRLAQGESMLTPEECLELWRAQNPSDDDSETEAQAIREAIDDMRAGDAGQALQEFLTEFRTRKRIPS
jgi:hypothetical protein